MIRLIAAAGFALAVATSADAMTPAPIQQPDGIITQVAYACGPGRTRVGGICVARTTAERHSLPPASAGVYVGMQVSALGGTETPTRRAFFG